MSGEGVYPYRSAWKPSAAAKSIASKASQIARGRYKNRKVTKNLKKGPTKTIVKGNKNAIVTLSRQVKQLQLQRYGNIQRMNQYLYIAHDGANVPLSQEPMLYCFNQFKVNTPLYSAAVSTTGATAGQPILDSGPHLFGRSTFDTDLNHEYQWEEQHNLTTSVSIVEYLPVYSNLTIHLTGQIAQTDAVLKYRFTLFQTRKLPVASSKKDFSLPYNAGALWHMANQDPSIRNHFSKSYHKIIQDRWVTICPPTAYTGVMKVDQTVRIPYSFGKIESLKLNLSNDPTGQSLLTNIRQDQAIWLLISCSASTAPGINLALSRSVTWRDRHGVEP